MVNAFLCHKDCHPDAVNADAKLVLARQLQAHSYSLSTAFQHHVPSDDYANCMAVLAQGPPDVPLDVVTAIRLKHDLGHFAGTDKRGRHNCCLHTTRRRTTTFCITCGVYLHREVCFYLFHHCADLLALMNNTEFQAI